MKSNKILYTSKRAFFISALILSSTMALAFDLNSIAKGVMDKVVNEPKKSTESKTALLDNSTISSGLKEALKVGVDYAVKNLGEKDGYLKNLNVKIPLPENLQKTEATIRKFGGNEIADNLIKSMNNAATNAAPQTASIFIKAIEQMSLDEAQKILNGDKNAATNYFKTNTSESLKKLIMPIVQKTMKENQVASYYDSFNSYYKQYGKGLVENSDIMNMAKNFGVDSYLPSSSEQSLDEYVTNKAIDGLFKMIASKESQIRENPIEQTTALLKKVFAK